MHPEALIIRRCYPVPVTFADLRAAAMCGQAAWYYAPLPWCLSRKSKASRTKIMQSWHASIKQVTGAIDEVYAVVDGREVRVATIKCEDGTTVFDRTFDNPCGIAWGLETWFDLFDRADRAGYWERPHEVRLDLSPRPVSHNEVAKAVLVGQEYVERLPIPTYRAMAGKTSICDTLVGRILDGEEKP